MTRCFLDGHLATAALDPNGTHILKPAWIPGGICQAVPYVEGMKTMRYTVRPDERREGQRDG